MARASARPPRRAARRCGRSRGPRRPASARRPAAPAASSSSRTTPRRRPRQDRVGRARGERGGPCRLAAPTTAVVTSSPRTPWAANTSASPSLAAQVPTAPAATSACATSGHLWVLPCGRNALPRPHVRGHGRDVGFEGVRSSSSAGVGISSRNCIERECYHYFRACARRSRVRAAHRSQPSNCSRCERSASRISPGNTPARRASSRTLRIKPPKRSASDLKVEKCGLHSTGIGAGMAPGVNTANHSRSNDPLIALA